jgi:hypothetical protein
MTPADSVLIPADRLAPIAREAASGAKTVASVICFFIGMFTIAAIGVLVDTSGSATQTTMDGGSMIVGMGIWFVVLGSIASKFFCAARRAAEAAKLAAADVGHQFFLSGKLIVVADATGVVQPQMSFKLSEKLRRMLMAVPQATVIARS